MSALTDIPAIAQMAAFGPRFVLWKDFARPGEKSNKKPLRLNGRTGAKSNDAATWSSLERAEAAAAKRDVDGVGVMLGRLPDGRWLVGMDLDLCRSRTTGELEAWARRHVDRLRTYTEVSPSGTGLKCYGVADRLPPALWNAAADEGKGLEATPPGAAVPEGAEGTGHKVPEIGLYPQKRYFCLTGQHLDGTPDELVDVTEAFAEIAHEVASMAAQADPAPDPAAAQAPEVDLSGLPPELREVVEADDKLRAGWATGAKLTKGKDGSASGLEFSLVNHLAWRGHPDGLIELAVRHYPHGQVGSGKLTGGNARRRMDKLLAEADRIRERGERWQERQAWFAELSCGEGGEPHDCLGNGALILRKDPALAGRLRFDEHRGGPVCRDLPWRPGERWREWENIDDIRLADWCHQRGVRLRPGTCADAVAAVADENRFHPIRDYLDGLSWDGVPRLDTWLETHLGVVVHAAEDADAEERARAAAKLAYVRQVARRWPVSAVARIYRPGCKVDTALVEEGPQGGGKSSALAALVPVPEWFTDEISDLGSKDAAQDLRGKWIVELAELSAMKRAEVERAKAFFSRSTDHYRPSYGRRSQDFPRQCVFAGTTNADCYLGDETGNRRFWPVRVGRIDLAAVRRDRDQLWAEAVVALKAGERWWLDPGVEKAAAEEQAERRLVDPWEEELLDWAARRADPVSIPDALAALDVPRERRDQAAANRVARIFKAAGWERFQRREGGARTWAYRKPSPVSPDDNPPTGDEKTSNGAGVTSVTSVTGRSETFTKTPPPPWPSGLDFNVMGGGGPGRNFKKKAGDTGDTGDTPCWRDHRWWVSRVNRARTRDEVNLALAAWAHSAGGEVTAPDEVLTLVLPRDLERCLGRAELLNQARLHKLAIVERGRGPLF